MITNNAEEKPKQNPAASWVFLVTGCYLYNQGRGHRKTKDTLGKTTATTSSQHDDVFKRTSSEAVVVAIPVVGLP